MKGYVDKLSVSAVEGWAFDPGRPDTPLQVTVHVDDRQIAVGRAAQHRKDVADLFGSSGMHGFSLPIEGALEVARLADVRVEVSGGAEAHALANPFAEEVADTPHSRAWTKACQYLPEDVEARALILGDLSPALWQRLRERESLTVDQLPGRAPEATPEARPGSGGGLYDYVLVTDVRGLSGGRMVQFEAARHYCKSEGVILLECFLSSQASYLPEMNFHFVSLTPYEAALLPTAQGLQDILLSGHVARYIHASGRSGTSAGSHIYLCRKRLQTVIVVNGPTRSGKSSLARGLWTTADQYISLDLFITHLRKQARHGLLEPGPLRDVLLRDSDLTRIYPDLQGPDCLEELARLVSSCIVASAERVIIEGVGASEAFATCLEGLVSDRARIATMSSAPRGEAG